MVTICLNLEIQKSKMADPQYGNNDLITRHMASSARNADLKGDIFRRTVYFLNLAVIAYILSNVRMGGGGGGV